MNLNDLLRGKGLDPAEVLVLRHCPTEPELNRAFPKLAAERPDIFNAYQQTQGERVERSMKEAKYVASFIGWGPGKAIFVGLYAVRGAKPISRDEFWQIPAHVYLRTLGLKGFCVEGSRQQVLWFELEPTDFYADWKGKLIVGWPGKEIQWSRWAINPKKPTPVHQMPVLAILAESALVEAMPKWNELLLSWNQLNFLPESWRATLKEWRGIYYIFDESDRMGYVGAAYGENNLLGRWENYAARGQAARGHGGNRLLKGRDPKNFQFTILELVAQAMPKNEVIELENNWKRRLHTRYPHGLNDN